MDKEFKFANIVEFDYEVYRVINQYFHGTRPCNNVEIDHSTRIGALELQMKELKEAK